MLEYFPQLLDGLLKLLADEVLEIRIETDNVLNSFLSEIKSSVINTVIMNSIVKEFHS